MEAVRVKSVLRKLNCSVQLQKQMREIKFLTGTLTQGRKGTTEQAIHYFWDLIA